jgi:hypothetical protein
MPRGSPLRIHARRIERGVVFSPTPLDAGAIEKVTKNLVATII